MRTAETIRHWPKRTCLVRSQNWHLPFMVPLFVKGSLKGSGCSWECIGKNSVRFHQRMLNNYSDLAGQWRTKNCTNKPLQLKWYPYCTSLARWSLCGWDSRHMGWSKRATAAVKQLATAQQWSLGGGLLKFRTLHSRVCALFWFRVGPRWPQGMKYILFNMNDLFTWICMASPKQSVIPWFSMKKILVETHLWLTPKCYRNLRAHSTQQVMNKIWCT